jgi:hypothetical protein
VTAERDRSTVLRDAAATLTRLGYIDEAREVRFAIERMENESTTIEAYQRLTGTDYPGTLGAYIKLGRVTFPDPRYQPDPVALARWAR